MPAPPMASPWILRIAQLRALEERHRSDGLMERAGVAAAKVAAGMINQRGPVVVLAGPGNNGGDAFVVARHLLAGFHEVAVVFRGEAARLPPDAKAAHAALVARGANTISEPPGRRPALVVDGLFGIGLTRALDPAYAALVEWANASGAPILALDAPSGLDSETGVAQSVTVRASATATFIALKPGLVTGDGPDFCGEVSVHALGVEVPGDTSGRLLQWTSLSAALPIPLLRNARNVHKGTFGTLSIIGGASGMTGATVLAGRAALRSGAGRVRIGMLAVERFPYDPAAPELMIGNVDSAFTQADALVVGPGLGTSDAAAHVVRRAIETDLVLLLDADGLNVVAQDASLARALSARTGATLMTPHPAEAARLLACDTREVEQDRLACATTLATRFGAGIVLKGAGSVLVYPDARFDINASGNAALATAGSGDVLSGIAGAFLAQGIDPRTALRYAVCLHGACADALLRDGVGPLGVTASELPDVARKLINDAARATRATRDPHSPRTGA